MWGKISMNKKRKNEYYISIIGVNAMKKANFVYLFTEGKAEMKALLGGKGANLAEMKSIGLPVPPGLTITTEACKEYFKRGKKVSEDLEGELWLKLVEVEKETEKIW